MNISDIKEALEFAGIGIYTYNLEGLIQTIDRITLKILDIEDRFPEPSLLAGKNISELLTSPWPDEMDIKKIQKNKFLRAIEFPIKTISGLMKWVICDVSLIQNSTEDDIIRVIIHDITERKYTYNELDNSWAKYKAIVETFDGLIYICSEDYTVEFMNKHFIERTGYNGTGQKCFKVLHELEEICPWCVNEKIFRSETVKWEILSPKDNRWYYIVNTPVYHSNGTISKMAMIQDITERKKAEELLASEKEHLAVTLRSIGDGVITTDIEGKIVLINKAAEHITGWSEEDARGKYINEVFHIINEKSRKPCENPVAKVLKTFKITTIPEETLLIGKDGSEKLISNSGAPILDKNGKIIGVVLVFRDITEQTKLEEEILKANKIESLGVLAGGIAHDFNNILTTVIGNITLGKMYTKQGDEIYDILTEAENASLRAKNLTRQLLTFAKGGSPIKMCTSISELIKETTCFALSGSNVKSEFHIPPSLWPVEIDASQISQVINNIIINAKESMPHGGKIEIKVENVNIKSTEILPFPEGKYLKINIKDSGTGITKENLPKIFDPYFTTKHEGKGIGLTTAYSIIKKHEGYINAESDYGYGTTFYIYLPAIEYELKDNDEINESIKKNASILLMDDEPLVLKTTEMILHRLGYKVQVAKDGTEVIEIYKKAQERGQPFDVIIMDLTIPGGMGGKEAIEKLKEINPEVKAIVSSGYSNDPVMAEFKKYGFKGVVAKPYKISEFKEMLHKILVERSSDG
ncbi:MAG TPA: PAS domain S-box protein [Candidatus Eremiobacteraeota bacterium]|nr:MAG: Blue-light-activated protein [bacterium ADurb.Bin363]HPZ08314.1 PAS domain S-box protein [Candidatus Eremiobacteraeota bacterium]